MELSARQQRGMRIGVVVAVAVLALPVLASADTGLERGTDKIVDLLTGRLAIAASIAGVAMMGYQLLFGDTHHKGALIMCLIGIVVVNGAAQYALWFM